MELPSAFSFHKRSAKQRREQRLRAEARTALRLFKGFSLIIDHRGNQLPPLGAALVNALSQVVGPAPTTNVPMPPQQQQKPLSRTSVTTCRHFLQGRCTWGDQCRFAHPQVHQQQQQQQQQQSSSSAAPFNADADEFVPMSQTPMPQTHVSLDIIDPVPLPHTYTSLDTDFDTEISRRQFYSSAPHTKEAGVFPP